jgi:hypothetical protein
MPWTPPDDAKTPEKLSDWWSGTCRKWTGHQQFFVSLGWGDRLSRLFAVACSRAAYGPKMNARSRELLDLMERFADGLVTREEWLAADESLGDELLPAPHQAAFNLVCMKPEFAAGWLATQRKHRPLFGTILRAMVGPGMPWSDEWRTETAVLLARGIYDERAWDRMPVLSDALQDAGCSDHRVLGYCRGDGPFCRGCWLLDVLLGKR